MIGEFCFSVDDETLLRHDLKVGKRLDERAYEQLREQTQYQKAKEKAFSLLSRRSYASAQLRQKLEGDFPPDCIDRVMERCADLGLIDDLDYAQRAARDLVHLKHYSLSRVRQELAHRGIGQNEIEDALELFAGYDERPGPAAAVGKKVRCFPARGEGPPPRLFGAGASGVRPRGNPRGDGKAARRIFR